MRSVHGPGIPLRNVPELNRQERIEKIRTLAHKGATEGERAAARAALERMGEPLEAPRVRPGAYFNPHFEPTRSYEQAQRQSDEYVKLTEEMFESVSEMLDRFEVEFARLRKEGYSEEEAGKLASEVIFRRKEKW